MESGVHGVESEAAVCPGRRISGASASRWTSCGAGTGAGDTLAGVAGIMIAPEQPQSLPKALLRHPTVRYRAGRPPRRSPGLAHFVIPRPGLRQAPRRPYVSLIVSKVDDQVVFGGRVFHGGDWYPISRFPSDRASVHVCHEEGFDAPDLETVARLAAAFGDDAARRLQGATVGVVGAGGTGSAAIEVLARAGVGRLIIVDPDDLEPSNLERVHGSWPRDGEARVSKSEIARRHVGAINKRCEVVAVKGALPQGLAVDKLVEADVILGCTDQQHSRLALSDLVVRYLVPAIDCGVSLEGSEGVVRGQIIQLLRWLPADPCALCRGLIDPRRVSQELMSEQERESRRAAAKAANPDGEPDSAYWEEIPQLNTVGYLPRRQVRWRQATPLVGSPDASSHRSNDSK